MIGSRLRRQRACHYMDLWLFVFYKTVRITAKDTLWSIAKDNYRKEYGSLQNYIKDIKECNSLSSDSINAGCSIIVPVYVQEHSADQN